MCLFWAPKRKRTIEIANGLGVNFDLSVSLWIENGMIEPPSGREVARLAVTEGARGIKGKSSPYQGRIILSYAGSSTRLRREPPLGGSLCKRTLSVFHADISPR